MFTLRIQAKTRAVSNRQRAEHRILAHQIPECFPCSNRSYRRAKRRACHSRSKTEIVRPTGRIQNRPNHRLSTKLAAAPPTFSATASSTFAPSYGLTKSIITEQIHFTFSRIRCGISASKMSMSATRFYRSIACLQLAEFASSCFTRARYSSHSDSGILIACSACSNVQFTVCIRLTMSSALPFLTPIFSPSFRAVSILF